MHRSMLLSIASRLVGEVGRIEGRKHRRELRTRCPTCSISVVEVLDVVKTQTDMERLVKVPQFVVTHAPLLPHDAKGALEVPNVILDPPALLSQVVVVGLLLGG